jgi:hypothetical protein
LNALPKGTASMRRLILTWVLVCSIGALGHAQREQAKEDPRDKQQQAASESTNKPPIPSAHTVPQQVASNNPGGVKSTDVLMVLLTASYVTVSTFLLIAVRKQVEIAISGERAWLFEHDAPQYQAPDTRRLASCYIGFKNFGKSPAWIVSVAGSFQWIDDPQQLARMPVYGAINWGDIIPVPQDEAHNFVVSNRIGNERSANARLAVFVSIEYRDRFNLSTRLKPRRLKYCFISTDGGLSRWSKSGPDEYNKYT